MSTSEITDRTTELPAAAAPPRVIEDPVAYLATFGIESELVTETRLPAAA